MMFLLGDLRMGAECRTTLIHGAFHGLTSLNDDLSGFGNGEADDEHGLRCMIKRRATLKGA